MINGLMSKQFGVALLFSFHVGLLRNLCRISQSVSRPREGLARASSMLKWLHSEYVGIQGTLLATLASKLIVRFKDNLWWTFAQAAWLWHRVDAVPHTMWTSLWQVAIDYGGSMTLLVDTRIALTDLTVRRPTTQCQVSRLIAYHVDSLATRTS